MADPPTLDMASDGAQRQRIQDALLSAFTSEDELESLLSLRMNVALWEVVERAPLRTVVFDLIKWTDAHGRTGELVCNAHEDVPGNKQLQSLAVEFQCPKVQDSENKEFPEKAGSAGLESATRPNVSLLSKLPWVRITNLVAFATVVFLLIFIFMSQLLRDRKATTSISGHILFQNSDSVVKGAIVRLPDGTRKSDPTDDAGFFLLPNVPPQTPTLFVLVSGKLHELTVVNQAGYRYRVVPPIADPQPRLDATQATAVTELAAKQPGRFRIEGPESRHSSLWPVGATIRVAFLNGEGELKALVRQTAPSWSRHANVRFQFDDDPKTSDIRVSFEEPGAYSYRGTDALGISKKEPTVVLGAIAVGSPDNVSTILHEFGHVLGLVHEYQNPNAGKLFDWEKIYKKASQPPLRWTKQTVDSNLRPPVNLPKEYASKSFDPESIMMTLLPEDWFLTGVRLQRQGALSAGDRAFITQLYPN